MRYADDLLRVGGNFTTRSTLNHHSMLTDGRLELCGSFTQEGDACSFDSTGGFTVAFMGKYRSGVHFEDPHDSQFANIDPDYANYYTDDSPLEMAVRLGESILLGMKDSAEEQIEFSSDALVSEVAIAGLSVVTGEAVPFLLLAVTAGFIASDIADTTESNENMYIKARRYAKDVMDTIIMVSSLKCIRENRTPSESDFQDESLLKKIIRLFQSDDSDSSDFNSAGRLSTFLHISDDMWDLFGEALDADALVELKTIAAGICEEDDAGSVMLRVYNTVVQVREESGADRLDTDDIHVITDRVRDGDAYSLIRDILIVKEKPATSGEMYQRICSIGKDASLSHREKYVKMKRLYEAVEDKGDVMFPEDMKYVTGYNERGWPKIDWPGYMGFDKSRGITSISRTDGLPERWDRDGGMTGRNFSDVSDGQTYTYEEKSIPYLRNEGAHYTGKFRGDTYFDKIDAIAEGNLERLNTLLKKEGVAELDNTEFNKMVNSYQSFIKEVKQEGIQETATYGLKGWAAGLGDGKYTGGASQIVTPLSGGHLETLGVIIYE